MLKLQNISKSYPQRGVVLDNLNLEVKAGETLAIKGPSGSGKTTLLNIIGLLDKPDSGSVIFEENEIHNYDAKQSAMYRRESVGFVFQDHLLLPHLNIKENILLPLLAGKKSKDVMDEARTNIDNLMEKMGITGISESYPHEVSGGEAQRATLVRALANKPKLILADEPTGSLDNENGKILGSLLQEINKEFGTTIIAVTHSDDFASKLGRILNLSEGSIS